MEILLEELKSYIYFFMIPTILLIIYLYCDYKLSYWRRRGVTQLRNTSKIFGDFKDGILFRSPPGYYLGNIYREAPSDAPFVGFYIFHKPCLLLRDPEIIKQILTRDFDIFPNRHFGGSQQKDSIGMKNLFGLKNPAWRYLRKKITPAFTLGKLKQRLPLMMDNGKSMMNYIKKAVNNNNNTFQIETIDAQDLNYKYSADLIANIALGTKTDSFNFPDSGYSKFLLNYFYSSKRMVALLAVFFLPELVAVIGSLTPFDSSFLRKIFWSAVESRENSGMKRGDFIDSIIGLRNGKQNDLFRFEGDNLLSQSGMFFAGFKSGSTAAAFTLMELAKNKEYQERAREDIENAIEKFGWTMNAFNEMKYVDQCIAESVRLHPPVSTIDRVALEDYKIPNTNIIIEKGTPVFISLYGLHGDPKLFESPQVFNPERFGINGTIPEGYLPFGAGPRMCIGFKAAELHVKLVLSMILSEYEVYQQPEEVSKLDSRSVITAAEDGILLQFTKLNH